MTDRIATIAAALFIVGPLVAYIGIVSPMIGFGLFGFGGLLALITLSIGIFVAIRRGLPEARKAILFGGLVSVAFIAIALPGRGVPRINDITTDMIDPPRFGHAPSLSANQERDMSYPGKEFAEQQKAGYPTLSPLAMADAPDAAFAKVEQAAGAFGDWEVTRVDAAQRELEGVAVSGIFRFRDDFIVQVRPGDGGGSVIHMRSKSRDGRSDIGANAARIEAFFATLK